MSGQIVTVFIEPLLQLWESFVSIVPNIVACLVFLLIGLILARSIKSITAKALSKIKLDKFTSKIGINEIFARVGFGRSPSYALAFVMYWSVMLVFIVLAANALNLQIIMDLIKQFMYFIPKLVTAILIIFAGLLFAKFVHNIVDSSATVNNLRGGKAVAKIADIIIIVFAVLLALEQVGIQMSLITDSIKIIIASMGLALAIGFGLGSKDLIAKYLENKFTEDND